MTGNAADGVHEAERGRRQPLEVAIDRLAQGEEHFPRERDVVPAVQGAQRRGGQADGDHGAAQADDHRKPAGDQTVVDQQLGEIGLDEAEAGQRFFIAMLFDGTEVDGLNEISAVIGDLQPAGSAENALLERPSWPVQLAFFSLAEPTAEPTYEMSVTLYDNGIVDGMLIDYGDFVVRATLLELEPLDPPDC